MRAVLWRTSLYRLPRIRRLRVQNSNFHRTTRLASSRTPDNSSSFDRHQHDSPGQDEQSSNGADAIRDEAGKESRHARLAEQRRLSRMSKSTTGKPIPPPIPDWFLKYNVRLQEHDVPVKDIQEAEAINIRGQSNRHEGFTLPFIDPQRTQEETEEALNKQVASLKDGKDSLAPAEAQSDLEKQGPRAFFNSKDPSTAPVGPIEDRRGAAALSSKDETANAEASVKHRALLPQTAELDAQSWVRLQGQILLASIFDLAARVTGKESTTLSRHLHYSTMDTFAHDELDRFVEDVADLTYANLLRIDASDIAEMAGDYIDPLNDEEGTISNLAYDAFEGASAVPRDEIVVVTGGQGPTEGTDASDQAHEAVETGVSSAAGPGSLQGLRSFMARNQQLISQVLGGTQIGVGIALPMSDGSMQTVPNDSGQTPSSGPKSAKSKINEAEPDEYELSRWQQIKIEAFLDSLLDAVVAKPDADLSSVPDSFLRQKFPAKPSSQRRTNDLSAEMQKFFAINRARMPFQVTDIDKGTNSMITAADKDELAHDALRLHLGRHLQKIFTSETSISSTIEPYDGVLPSAKSKEPGLVVHLRDLDALRDTSQGEIVLERLSKVINKRRMTGQRIALIATSASENMPISTAAEFFDGEQLYSRLPYPSVSQNSMGHAQISPAHKSQSRLGSGYRRLVELNLRHVQEEIKRMRIPVASDLFKEFDRKYLRLRKGTNPATDLGGRALTHSDIQTIVSFANGFRSLYTTSEELNMAHLAVSMTLLDEIHSSIENGKTQARTIFNDVQVMDRQAEPPKNEKARTKPDLEQIRQSATKHEQRLLSGVVDPSNIKTTFSDVHADPQTIEALKTVTSLSLVRPEAFKYGVLANDRLPGLLLYGPPGTGKTLLAKAVAKDSSATVLEVSGAQIYEKYVGEGEKMVRAVFSLAKKLSPCVVFIDEADAIFGSRGLSGNRTTHREIINQFLRGWDGMDDQSVFMMVATNRPFDLDDAVLRRLPRRILVDLPVATDRQSILGIHLKGETIDESVALEKLAEQTPFYSGSDLKNVCVAAALAAVREESALLATHKDDEDFKLPDRRTLRQEHFDKAIQEISASISEDMSSLNAIKKFDEQFGDRRGRRKKSGYGFGQLNQADEDAARVRGNQDPRR